MNVIFYIGHHKVGSTALQVFLARNAANLLRAGILYPCVDMEGFSQLLARVVRTGDTKRWLPANAREPHSALAYRMMTEVSKRPVPAQFRMLPHSRQMMHAITQQVRYLQPDTVILCSEAFANFGDVDAGLIGRLRDLFPDSPLQIYCALRRPDEYIAAWHGQRIKVGEAIPTLRDSGLAPYLNSIHTDYRRVVAPWVAQIPEATLHLRNYADIRAAGGSPQDFFAQTGVDLPDDLLPADRQNPSLPMAAIEIKRRANLVLPHTETEKLTRYILRTGPEITATPDAQIDMLGPRDRQRLAQLFAPVHSYLSDLTGQEDFFPDADQIGQPRAVSELAAAHDYLGRMQASDMPTDALSGFIRDLQAEYGAGA